MARKAKKEVVSTESAVVESNEVVGPQEVVVLEMPESFPLVESAGKSMLAQLVQQVVESDPPKTEDKVKVEKNEGVGTFIKKLIGEGLGNKEILKIVHEQYGNENTTYACVAWYRNKMKKDGKSVAKSASLDWLQNFAKAHNLDESAVQELARKVA